METTAGGRIRFTELCETKGNLQRGGAAGLLPFEEVVNAFITSRLRPELSNEEFRTLFRALEVFHDEAQTIVNWRNLLAAPIKRETLNVYGIFPKIVSTVVAPILN